MKLFKKILIWILAILNTLFVLAMILCAYSVYLRPADFPNWSYLGMTFPFFIIATLIFLLIWPFVKWKCCAISILGIIVCWNSIRNYCPINLFQDVPGGKSFGILSYNVFMFHGYHEGKTDIADYILNSKADVVCLQEASGVKEEKLYSLLNKVYPYIETGESSGYECAFLSKFPILSTESIDFGTNSARCTVYEILVYDDTVKVYNCHLESYKLNDDDKHRYKQIIKQSVSLNKKDQAEDSLDIKESFWWLEEKLAKANATRSLQADKLNSLIKKENNQHLIVCGDFNDSPISYVHKTLTKQLKDAYTESGNGPGWSYNQNGMYFRIDHILISESFNSYNAKVDKYGKESDHYPIFCTLEMR